MEKPLISIIVPVYQVKDFFTKCIESILNQTYRNIEIILIDDGSTDGSGELCDEFAKKDFRIIVIHQKNGGVSKARNTGLEYAKGEFIGFVDSDDWIEADMFEQLLNAIKETGKQISVCGHIIYHTKKIKENKVFNQIPKVMGLIEGVEYLISDNYFEGFLWNKLFDRKLFYEDTPIFFDEKIHFCEDLLAVSRCFLKTSGIAYVDKALYHYQLREEGAMKSYNSKRQTELIGWKKVMDELSPLSKNIEIKLHIRYTNSAINLMRMAVLAEDKEKIPYYKKEIKKYWREYFFNASVSFKTKFRGVLIILFPKFSDNVWKILKKYFNAVWHN